MKVKAFIKRFLIVIMLLKYSCVDPFPVETESFENVLVVEATITDELKTQEIKLTRTYFLEQVSPIYEEDALVKIEDTNNNVYDFTYTDDGVYISNEQFQALEGVGYKLFIKTTDGNEYISNEELGAPKAEIENLYAKLVNLNGELGIQVLVDTNDNLGNANFFRYEFEETYKIVAPLWISNDGVERDSPSRIATVPRDIGERVCYSNNKSNEIIITSTTSLSENKISGFPVKFIPISSPTIRERYSILVTQYVQSADANNFYKLLKELGSLGDNIFVNNQPGTIQGNIFSRQSENEKVIGFFDVTSVKLRRIYFNYEDFELELPPYFFECIILNYDWRNDEGAEENERAAVRSLLSNGYKYLSGSTEIISLVRPECGNCTSFSSNIKPEFWID